MTHAPRGTVGFSHLADLLPFEITLTRGSRRVLLPAAELEARLALPGLAGRLAEVLTGTTDSVEWGVRGASRKGSLSLSANAVEKSLNAFALAVGVKEGSGEPSGGAPATTPVENSSPESLAVHLATKLGGRDAPAHLAFYRLVARTVPREIVLDALMRTLDAREIRKSRAHLFSYLVRKHLPRRSFTNEASP